MWTILANGVTIYEQQNTDKALINANLIQGINQAHRFTFTPSPENTQAQNLELFRTYIEVFDTGRSVFYGRIVGDETDTFGVTTYICEGSLAFFNDTFTNPQFVRVNDTSHPNAMWQYLSSFIAMHNYHINTPTDYNKRIILQNVEINFPPNTPPVFLPLLTPMNMLDALREYFLEPYGGVFVFERRGSLNYLDWVADATSVNSQAIALTTNVATLNIVNDLTGFVSGVLPLGEFREGWFVEAGTTNIHAGRRRYSINATFVQDMVVWDSELRTQLGSVAKPVIFDEVSGSEELRVLARNYLNKQKNEMGKVIDVDVFDMSNIDVSIERYRWMQRVNVASAFHGLNESLIIVKKASDLLDPRNDTMILGNRLPAPVSNSVVELRKVVNRANNNATQAQIESLTIAHNSMIAMQEEIEPLEKAKREHENLPNTITQ